MSTWSRDIELTPEQVKILEQNARDPYYGNRAIYLKKIKKQKDLKIGKLKDLGIKEIGKLTKRELFLTGVALYWAEGFKKDKQVGFANSDPLMIKIYLKWLNECFGYEISDLSLRVSINVSHKNRINKIQAYWSNVTRVPVENFQKPFYQNVTWKKIYENPNEYYGVLRIRVRKSLDFLRKIHGYIEGLKINIILI